LTRPKWQIDSMGHSIVDKGGRSWQPLPELFLQFVQKRTANTPILQRRNKLTSNIDQQITKIGLFREGKRISREQFWVDRSGVICFQLRYGRHSLELEQGQVALKAATFDELVAQLDALKTITIAEGLDDALSASANSVRANFKVAKDKKAAKGT